MGDSVKMHVIATCAVEVSPEEPVAGVEMTLSVRVACDSECDLVGHEVVMRDGAGDVALRLELGPRTEGANEASGVVTAPVVAGSHTWEAHLPEQMRGETGHAEARTPFSFTVKAHATSGSVWGVPSAVVAGERFSVTVGVACTHGCSQAGRAFEVLDGDGGHVVAGEVGTEVWPGTKGVYVAEIELASPPAVGFERWEVRIAPAAGEPPHDATSRGFGVTTVGAPEFTVTVEAIDMEHQTPVEGAHVLLHPFRAFTDERGVAELKVTGGEYKLYVSGFRYYTFSTPVEITHDLATRAELVVEPDPPPDEHYR